MPFVPKFVEKNPADIVVRIQAVIILVCIFQAGRVSFGQTVPADAVTREKDYFANLTAAGVDDFEKDFEFPFLLILDDADRRNYEALTSLTARKSFIKTYWRRLNPNPISPHNEFLAQFISRVDFVRSNFPKPTAPFFDDRGKYFIKYGEPSFRFVDKGGTKQMDYDTYHTAGPDARELTLQIRNLRDGRTGLRKFPVKVRDFSGDRLTLSGIQLFTEAGLDPRPFLAVKVTDSGLLIPQFARQVDRSKLLYCYFELYNLPKDGKTDKYEIELSIVEKSRRTGFLRKLQGLFSDSRKKRLGIKNVQRLLSDPNRQLMAIDLRNLSAGNYVLRIDVRKTDARDVNAVMEKAITILN